MTKPATIQTMPRPRGVLSDGTRLDLGAAKTNLERAEQHYRQWVLRALAEGSFAEVSKATGLSTNTLQRWKREAGR